MLVDRIFQPLADRLAARWSPFDLARAAIPAVPVALVINELLLSEHVAWSAFFVAGTALLVADFLHDIRRAERAPTNTRNPLIRSRLLMRAFIAGMWAFCVLRLALMPVQLWHILSFVGLSAWLAAEGFAACQRRPPAAQPLQSGVPVPAFVPESSR